MYKYRYHKLARFMIEIMKNYLEKTYEPEMAKHICAGMILHMEARGYYFPMEFKDRIVGKGYTWFANIK